MSADPITFRIEKKGPGLARAGFLKTPHGIIETPSFVTVGTKATVKAVTPEELEEYVGAQVLLANTYHLYLQPGEQIIKEAGGIHSFAHWSQPTITDSGGFQVFSLGVAYGTNITKFAKGTEEGDIARAEGGKHPRLATIDEDGVTFRSHIDGSTHRFTPECAIEIQHDIGADIIFAFDECTAPNAGHAYQEEALARTGRWAERCLLAHKEKKTQGLYGVIQGGRFEDLRKQAVRELGRKEFAGYGIGGSFTREDLDVMLEVVTSELPYEKPRHLLGIGKPEDLFLGVEKGIDTFDCVEPTRIARNGTLYTMRGPINILNAKYTRDFSPLDSELGGYVSENYTKAYLSHLFRSKEILASTLGSIHNLYFINTLVKNIRKSLLDGNFVTFRESFLKKYNSKSGTV